MVWIGSFLYWYASGARLKYLGKEGKEGGGYTCSTTNTVHVEPSVYMIEWLWDLERLPGVRRTLQEG